MKKGYLLGATCLAALGAVSAVSAETLTIATVNNDDMIIMQKLSSKWEQQTGNKINWVILEENVLRQKVTTDIATKGGSFDIITIGAYETPIWGKKGWLTELDDFKNYDYDDLLAPVKAGLSVNGKLYAVALLRRKLLHHVSQGPVRKGRPRHARAADLRPDQAVRRQTDRQGRGRLWHLPERKAGLGREHGVPRHAREHVRRQMVRHGVEAAADVPAMADGDHLLRRPDESRRPARAPANGFNENQALFAERQVRDVDRRDVGGRPHITIRR